MREDHLKAVVTIQQQLAKLSEALQMLQRQYRTEPLNEAHVYLRGAVRALAETVPDDQAP